LFIADFNPFLKDWERILLRIVHEEAQYFIPQIETKIMNEGWASFWHREILNSLNLPQDLHLEFLVRHNQVARPIHGGLNPYHLGLKTWDDIRHRYDEAKIGKICDDHSEDYDRNGAPGDLGKLSGLEKVFEVRLVERDSSFIRRFLTEHLIRELDLFEYKPKDKDLVISNVADSGGWKEVKETLMNNVGMKSVPVIKVTECDMAANRSLRILHDHDGRDLHLEYAEKTMGYLYGLWGAPVSIETELGGNKTLLNFDDKGFSTKLLK
ncbi:MAG: SpoVR family protein, partial [Candidatus Liptonbacteria bacterium]|nr:SpoVR family protein [Candidatus Liptonbacteria bacterium]